MTPILNEVSIQFHGGPNTCHGKHTRVTTVSGNDNNDY